MCDFFCYFNLERNYDVLKSKSPCILMNKNINFNKNEAKSKMRNSTQSLTETIILLQLIQESQIKCKTVMSWISRKKKRAIFVTLILSEGNVFNICVLSQCTGYWTHFQNMHSFTYQKTLLHYLRHFLFLDFKIQRQPLEVFCKRTCSLKFYKIHMKKPVLESLF